MLKLVSDQGPDFIGDNRRANTHDGEKEIIEHLANALALLSSAPKKRVDDSAYIARRLAELYGSEK